MLPIYSDKKPSDEFVDAFCSHGSCRWTCVCGRTYFSSDGGFNFDDGELEDLEKRAKDDPDACIDVGSCSVGVIHFAEDHVVGCMCNSLYTYEAFLWNNRYNVASYFKKKNELLENTKKSVEDIFHSIK